jgi:hypothetical protein
LLASGRLAIKFGRQQPAALLAVTMIEPNRALHFGAKARDLRHSGRLANLGGVPREAAVDTILLRQYKAASLLVMVRVGIR